MVTLAVILQQLLVFVLQIVRQNELAFRVDIDRLRLVVLPLANARQTSKHVPLADVADQCDDFVHVVPS